MAKNEEMFSMSYEDAKNKNGIGIGNNKMFMPKEMFDKKKAELNKTKQEELNKTKQEEKPKNNSLVADKFGDKKTGKNFEDVKRENGNDPAKMADWLNNNPGYKAGIKTKKGMEEFGYAQGEDGKWSIKQPTVDTTTTEDTTDTTTTPTTKPTTVETTSYTGTNTPTTDTTTTDTTTTLEDVNKKLQELSKQNEDLQNKLKQFQDKNGNFNEKNTVDAMAMYEQKMVEMGAGKFDKDGKFILKDTTKKGWEDYATMLSAGLSVVGLAMGIPIIPINFRKITNKDEKDAKIREFQKQYTDIFANGAAKVEDVNSSAEAGKSAKENEEYIKSYSKYKGDIGDYEAKSKIDTDSEKDLIETRTDSQIKIDKSKFDNDIKRLEADNNFKIKYATIMADKEQEMQKLLSDLSTNSTKELMKYKNAEIIKDIQELGLSLDDVAYYYYAQQGNTATDKNFGYIKDGVKTLSDILKPIK